MALAGIGHLQGGFSNFTWVSLLWSLYEIGQSEEDCASGTKQRLELLTVNMRFKTDRWVSLTSLPMWTRLLVWNYTDGR